MGIAGLLPLLKKASKNSHVRKFSGCTVAIDAYCWLHKGAFGCAEKLGKGEPTTAYITYCMKYIQVLLDNNIKPILVLDGRNLPSKAHTEKKRREKREENRKLARKYLQEGKRKEAWECFTKCVDITPAMAREFIKVLRSMKIDYVVAPYEADSQLAYLAQTGVADIIITEDSDLILFGCPKIFFKMSVNGDGVLFEQSKLPQCLGLTPSTFNFDRFRWMCILSGCDYLPSLPGIGLGRAKKVILDSNHDDIRQMILSIPNILVKVQVEVTEEYIDGFIQAENTFLYQLIFDTRKRMLLPLNPYPDNLGPKDLPFAGSYDTKEISLDLALGNIDLHSLKRVDSFEPLKSGYTTTSIWSSAFKPGSKNFGQKDTKAVPAIGMQIVSAGSTSMKKRPLAVVNSDNEDNGVDDNDLVKMYGETYTTRSGRESRKIVREQDNFSSEDEQDMKPSIKSENRESPSATKRRRISEQKTGENRNGLGPPSSPSCNTRSRNRGVPFLKSPEDTSKKIHVKSKYFRSEVKVVPKIEVKVEDDDSADSTDDESELPAIPFPNLNIYSYESSSQDSTLSDISASQRNNTGSQNMDSSSSGSSLASAMIKQCSVVIKKSEIPEITLEEEDEAYESSSASKNLRSSTPSSPLKRPVAKTPLPVAKPAYRRQGLSRSAKKDPKQPSVKDMFTRHKSVQ